MESMKHLLPVSLKILLCLVSSSIVQAGNTNDPPYSMEVSVLCRSPGENFYIEQHRVYPKEELKVWLVSTKDAKERKLIYTHGRSIEVLFSEDEKWLAINDHLGSNIAEVILFRQNHGIDYRNVENPSDKAWDYLAKKMGIKKAPDLDHYYAEVLRWTDNHTILLCLYGHTDSRNFVEDWLCLYDVTSKTFSTDLDIHNKRHVTLQPQ